ncbi:MAG: type II toxin-antitoxin system Phd/YefM family antitoxin [Anaerotruncus sp.]|nr:type II toxin-antitoxin system Phd/YefM family antitoxin [Anaerotruncus sp.]
MMINSNLLIAMTEANQNFSKVARLVDEQGSAVILKNNKPRYAVIDFSEYDQFLAYRTRLIDRTADQLIEENLEAFQELAK